jgi:hypothetical protein
MCGDCPRFRHFPVAVVRRAGSLPLPRPMRQWWGITSQQSPGEDCRAVLSEVEVRCVVFRLRAASRHRDLRGGTHMAGAVLSSRIHTQNQRLTKMLHVQHRCIVEGCGRLRRPGFTKCTHHLQGMFSERVKKGHVTRRRRMRRFEEGQVFNTRRIITTTSPMHPLPFAIPMGTASPSIGVPTLSVVG